MADFLVMTIDKGGVESGYKKGDIVEVFPDGRLQPQPPNVPFVLIRVPGMAVNRALHGMWRQSIGYEIVASNALGFRIRIFAQTVRASDNLGGVTRAQVEGFLFAHGGTVVSATTNEVIFDVSRTKAPDLKDAIISKMDSTFIRRRLYHVPVAVVDAALANGGVAEYTEAQATAYLKRKAD